MKLEEERNRRSPEKTDKRKGTGGKETVERKRVIEGQEGFRWDSGIVAWTSFSYLNGNPAVISLGLETRKSSLSEAMVIVSSGNQLKQLQEKMCS